MSSSQTLWAQVNEQGHWVLPPELVNQYGLKPGARLRIDGETNSVCLARFAAAVRWSMQIKKTAWAMSSPRAVHVCGRKA